MGRRWIGSELGNCKIITDRFDTIERDKMLLEKVYEEKNVIFPKTVRELRLKNGFWLSEDFNKIETAKEDGQLTLDELINSKSN